MQMTCDTSNLQLRCLYLLSTIGTAVKKILTERWKHSQYPRTVKVWANIIINRIIGQNFLGETVNSEIVRLLCDMFRNVKLHFREMY